MCRPQGADTVGRYSVFGWRSLLGAFPSVTLLLFVISGRSPLWPSFLVAEQERKQRSQPKSSTHSRLGCPANVLGDKPPASLADPGTRFCSASSAVRQRRATRPLGIPRPKDDSAKMIVLLNRCAYKKRQSGLKSHRNGKIFNCMIDRICRGGVSPPGICRQHPHLAGGTMAAPTRTIEK